MKPSTLPGSLLGVAPPPVQLEVWTAMAVLDPSAVTNAMNASAPNNIHRYVTRSSFGK